MYDRIGVVLTLGLTAVAYSITIADELGPLGFLTFLDKYILYTFAFIAGVGVEITAIEFTREIGNTYGALLFGRMLHSRILSVSTDC
jgi:hypothetical protein